MDSFSEDTQDDHAVSDEMKLTKSEELIYDGFKNMALFEAISKDYERKTDENSTYEIFGFKIYYTDPTGRI